MNKRKFQGKVSLDRRHHSERAVKTQDSHKTKGVWNENVCEFLFLSFSSELHFSICACHPGAGRAVHRLSVSRVRAVGVSVSVRFRFGRFAVWKVPVWAVSGLHGYVCCCSLRAVRFLCGSGVHGSVSG